MRRWVPVAALVAVGVLAGGVAYSARGDDAPRVQLASVSRGSVDEVVEAPGTVAAKASASPAAPADGVVEAVLVQDGEHVTTGQVLVRLRSDSAQQHLRAAESAAAQAAGSTVHLPRTDLSALQAQLDAAAQTSTAAGRAAAAQVTDPQQRDAAEKAVEQAQQQYAAAAATARAALQQVANGVGSLEQAVNAVTGAQRVQATAAVTAARAVVDALTVLSPIDGVVTLGAVTPSAGTSDLSSVLSSLGGAASSAQQLLGGSASGAKSSSTSLTVGQPVSSGSPLLTVTDVSGLGVTADVDETDVLQVRPGVQASVQLDAVPGSTYAATVMAVDETPTPSARGGVAYAVRLQLGAGRDGDGAPAPTPKPGMSAVVDLQVRSSAATSLQVPSSAVVRDSGRDAVLVLSGDRLQRRVVRLGAQGQDRVEVAQGLAEGDRVVVRDADRLHDGQRVQR